MSAALHFASSQQLTDHSPSTSAQNPTSFHIADAVADRSTSAWVMSGVAS
jgi:hypothetical protein